MDSQSSDSDKPLISIIIPNNDNVKLLKACIERIETMSSYKNYEILVIDNGNEKEVGRFDEKMKIIAASNALVFPSLCEGFGLVILEAFSQRKPVLVSNIKPMSDFI